MNSMKPSRISALYFLIIAILAVLCLLVPEDGIHIDLRWPTMREMLDMQTDTTAQVAQVDSVVEVPQIDENEVDTLRDTRWYMRRHSTFPNQVIKTLLLRIARNLLF